MHPIDFIKCRLHVNRRELRCAACYKNDESSKKMNGICFSYIAEAERPHANKGRETLKIISRKIVDDNRCSDSRHRGTRALRALHDTTLSEAPNKNLGRATSLPGIDWKDYTDIPKLFLSPFECFT
ncbi:hypothetical protein YQE_11961, partial [Dendroctonus ponderosae]